jgi:hypothetical protein
MSMDRLFAPVTGPDLIDRDEIINRLLRNFRDIDRPWAQQYALIGSRRSGKTSVLREVYRRMKEEPWENMPIPVWLDIKEMAEASKGDEERFARFYLAAFARDYLEHELGVTHLPPWEEFAPEQILPLAEQIGDGVLARRTRLLIGPSTHPNKEMLMVDLPGDIVREHGKRFAIIVDEVQDLARIPHGFSLLVRYRRAFESIFCLHVFTGSAVRIMSCDIFGYSSALYGRVNRVFLDPFPPQDNFRLMDKLGSEYGMTWTDEARFLLHELTGGYPFYTTCVAERLSSKGYREVRPEQVEEAFREELLQGRIHLEFVDRTDPQMKAMGDPDTATRLLSAIVHAEENQVGLENLRDLPGYHFEVVDALARADIIRLNGLTAYMVDVTYKTWLRDVYLEVFWGPRSGEQASESLRTTLGRLVNDVGRLFEAKVRDLLHYFAGQSVDGAWLGVPGQTMTLPSLENIKTRVLYAGNDLPEAFEVDVHAYVRESGGRGHWFVECKYTDEPPTWADVERLLHKRDLFLQAFSPAGIAPAEVTPWFCTKQPLSEEVFTWAREQGVYVSSEADIEALFAALREG